MFSLDLLFFLFLILPHGSSKDPHSKKNIDFGDQYVNYFTKDYFYISWELSKKRNRDLVSTYDTYTAT